MTTHDKENIECLLTHAGLSRDDPGNNGLAALLFNLKQEMYREVDVPQLVRCIAEIIGILDKLNRSDFATRLDVRPDSRIVDASLAYAVGEIIRDLSASVCDIDESETPTQVRQILSEAVELISVSLSAYLAGDIEDLLGEVRIADRCRNRLVSWFPDEF